MIGRACVLGRDLVALHDLVANVKKMLDRQIDKTVLHEGMQGLNQNAEGGKAQQGESNRSRQRFRSPEETGCEGPGYIAQA